VCDRAPEEGQQQQQQQRALSHPSAAAAKVVTIGDGGFKGETPRTDDGQLSDSSSSSSSQDGKDQTGAEQEGSKEAQSVHAKGEEVVASAEDAAKEEERQDEPLAVSGLRLDVDENRQSRRGSRTHSQREEDSRGAQEAEEEATLQRMRNLRLRILHLTAEELSPPAIAISGPIAEDTSDDIEADDAPKQHDIISTSHAISGSKGEGNSDESQSTEADVTAAVNVKSSDDDVVLASVVADAPEEEKVGRTNRARSDEVDSDDEYD
jgi:hypothetical protein